MSNASAEYPGTKSELTNHLKNRTMERLNGKLESLKKAFKKVDARRIAVVQQPSVSVGHIEIHYASSANTLYYEVKRHPISSVMTLYLYPDRESLMYHIPKARVYKCVITDVKLIPLIIKRIHKVNRPLHNWGAPNSAMYYEWTARTGRLHPTDQMLLDKIAELQDWACQMGYPLHEVLAEEHSYYTWCFRELKK